MKRVLSKCWSSSKRVICHMFKSVKPPERVTVWSVRGVGGEAHRLFLLQNKSAFLCGVMKTYRQREKQGTKVSDSSKGPDEAKIKALLDRTEYTLDVTTGQRKYGGPPPESVHKGAQPPVGTEVGRRWCHQGCLRTVAVTTCCFILPPPSDLRRKDSSGLV